MNGASLQWRTALRAGLTRVILLSLVIAAPLVSAAGQESDPHAQHRQMMLKEMELEPAANTTDVSIPDVSLLTQNGDSVNLRNDVIGDKIVVIDFVYTTCTTICPVLSAILGQVQGHLADRLGKDVILVSVTVDPLRDTPARLKAYSEKHHAGAGWLWLTGDQSSVDVVLQKLGVYTPNFADHPSTILVGDAATGEWSRFIGFPGAEKIMDKINEFSTARTMQSAAKE
jgi:protein SCO1/2